MTTILSAYIWESFLEKLGLEKKEFRNVFLFFFCFDLANIKASVNTAGSVS